MLRFLLLLARTIRAAVAIGVLAFATAATAQTEFPPPDIPAGLDPKPIRVESMGLTLHPPQGAVSQTRRLDDRTSLSLFDGGADPSWSVSVRPLVPTLNAPQGSTPAAFVSDIMATFRNGGTDFEVLENRPITIGGLAGHVCYIHHAPSPERPIVSGWLILDRGESELLVFASQVLPGAFPSVRPLLDACCQTIRIDALADVALSRKARLDAGRDMLLSFTPERLRAVMGPTRWYRYYRPAPPAGGSDQEMGYFSVECREGPQGAIDPARAPSRYDKSEEAQGFLVIVRGHYIEHVAGSTYDTQACYWMAWDQSEEAWSIRGTRRYRGQHKTEAETGIRTPSSVSDPAGTVTVIGSGVDGSTRDQQSWRAPEVYLSQALRWKLGELLPRGFPLARSMSTYAFDSTAPRMTISLRTDRWEPLEDRSGGWKLTTRTRTDAPELVAYYDAAGKLIERRHPDGVITAQIELDDLHRLWKNKGLPTGRIAP